jgi:hypothetical protein
MPSNIQQIIQITSEALQKKIRNLLPSQQGFGVDLQASNVIVPIVDLTAAAEGSTTGTDLQTALAFGSQTAFAAKSSTVVVANTAGFYRIFGTSSVETNTGFDTGTEFQMSDGLSTKAIWKFTCALDSSKSGYSTQYDFIVFLRSGDSISAISDAPGAFIEGSVRQIADVNGNLVNPSGFTPQ